MTYLPRTANRQLPYRARLAIAALTGGLERAAAELADRIDWSHWRPDRPTILCLRRSAFASDIKEMRRRIAINFVEVSAARVRRIQEAWIAPAYRLQTFFYQLLDAPLSWEREQLRCFGTAFLAAGGKRHPIDAVLAGNTDYWQDEAIKLGCKTVGIPFLVLGRENYSLAYDAEYVAERFASSKFRFNGAGVAVLSKSTQEVMDQSGCFAPGSVWTTGAPRFDAWHDVRSLAPEERDLVLLINYKDPAYQCPDNFREVLSQFVAAARRSHSTVKFAIKVKKSDDIPELRAEFPMLADAPVELIFDQPLQALYPRTRLVIGTNSLAIIESLLLDMPLIVPWWADAALPESKTLLYANNPLDAQVAYYPRSLEAFEELLAAGIKDELPRPGRPSERVARLWRHVAIPEDGATVSSVIEQFLRHYMSGSGAQSAIPATGAKNRSISA